MKYIIFDLDHTLLNNDRSISDYTYKVLKKYQNKGHKLVVNTARSLPYSLKHVLKVQPDYAIVNGGALVVNKELQPIYKKEIAADVVAAMVKDLLKVAENISVDTDDGFFVSDPHYRNQDAIYYDFEKGFYRAASKLVVQTKDPSIVADLVKRYQLEHSQYINGDWHRISPQGCSKWNGIVALLAYTGDKIEDTITFGDDIGDLEMLEKAGVGVAMANSIPQVLAVIKNVTKSNEEDGVAFYLENTLK